MSISDLQRAIETIARMPNAHFDGPKPESLIAGAEHALGLTFPPTYRAFLSCLGCGSLGGYEFYGVIKDDFEHSGVPDAIWLTLKTRKTAGLLDTLILVSDTGYGGYYAIDLSRRAASGESPVVEWQAFDTPEVHRLIAEDFGAFLWEIVEWAQSE